MVGLDGFSRGKSYEQWMIWMVYSVFLVENPRWDETFCLDNSNKSHGNGFYDCSESPHDSMMKWRNSILLVKPGMGISPAKMP